MSAEENIQQESFSAWGVRFIEETYIKIQFIHRLYKNQTAAAIFFCRVRNTNKKLL